MEMSHELYSKHKYSIINKSQLCIKHNGWVSVTGYHQYVLCHKQILLKTFSFKTHTHFHADRHTEICFTLFNLLEEL